MSWTARKAGTETTGGDSCPPAAMVNVAGTRALVLAPELPEPGLPELEPPELPELEPPETPAPPVGCNVLVVFVPGVVRVVDVAVVVVCGPLVEGDVAIAVEVVLSGAVGVEAAVLVAGFELPQPVASTSAGTTARISARRLKDRCIAPDIERVDEAWR